MSKTITFGEAKDRFASLATSGLNIGDAISMAVEQVYDSARWQGTTTEKELTTQDYWFDEELSRWFIHIDPDTYNGVVGLRTNRRGYEIQDITALFRDGVPAGQFDFVDMGIVEFNDGKVRRYRCPFSWDPNACKTYALIKLQPPALNEDSDVVPIMSSTSLRYATLAVSYEYVSDDERAKYYWAKFEEAMTKAQKQYNGPKRMSIKVVSTLRRRPSQFK